MKRWEYKWVGKVWPELDGPSEAQHITMLNELGVEGWELVDVWNGESAARYIFKREVSS
jgi:hypothetical protein